MKKTLISALVAVGLAATGAYANSIIGSGTYIGLGANNYSVKPTGLNSTSNTGFSAVIGTQKVWHSNILAAIETEYDQTSILGNTVNDFGANLKVGYKIQSIDTGVYAIGSGMSAAIGNGITAAGFGYGAGIEYTPWKHFGVALDYVTYPSMTTNAQGLTVDTSIAKAYVKYIF